MYENNIIHLSDPAILNAKQTEIRDGERERGDLRDRVRGTLWGDQHLIRIIPKLNRNGKRNMKGTYWFCPEKGREEFPAAAASSGGGVDSRRQLLVLTFQSANLLGLVVPLLLLFFLISLFSLKIITLIIKWVILYLSSYIYREHSFSRLGAKPMGKGTLPCPFWPSDLYIGRFIFVEIRPFRGPWISKIQRLRSFN